MNNRYNNSKIYKLIDLVDEYYYIGSTCMALSKRLYWHKNASSKFPERKVYKYINSIGWENIKIILHQELYLENKEQLLRAENDVIMSCIHDNKCLNCRPALLTPEETKERRNNYYLKNKETLIKEYNENNRDKIKEKRHIYYENNKDIVHDKWIIRYEKDRDVLLNYQKEYRENNGDKIKQYMKQYRESNKETIKEKQSEIYTCECGMVLTKQHKLRHEKSKKHQSWLNDQEATAETI